jgi:hypothetical protein
VVGDNLMALMTRGPGQTRHTISKHNRNSVDDATGDSGRKHDALCKTKQKNMFG